MSASISPSASLSQSPSISRSDSPSLSKSSSVSRSNSPSLSKSASISRSASVSESASVSISPSPSEGFGIVTIQPSGGTGVDTYVDESVPNTNNGTATGLFVRNYSPGGEDNVLIKFDLSSIPTGATITRVVLSLYGSGGTISADVSVYRILDANSSWTELGATWNYAVDGVTRWAGDTGSNGGVDAGCSVSGTDYSATIMGQRPSFDFTNGVENQILLDLDEFDLMLASNNGIVIKRDDAGVLLLQFHSSDTATAAYAPKLTVEFSLGSASISPSFSVSESPSVSPTISASASVSPSESPSVSPSASPTESPSESPSVSPSVSQSASASPTESPSVSPSPSASVSPSASPTESPSESPSVSPSVSQSASESPSVSPSFAGSTSASPSVSPSRSVSVSASRSVSPSRSVSVSASVSVSRSLSSSPSRSHSRSPSFSPSPSLTSASPSQSHSPSPVYIPAETMFSGAYNRYLNNTGLSVQFSVPIAPKIWNQFGVYASNVYMHVVPLDLRVTAYQHTINADGGYESASITMAVDQDEIDDWIENGLGRDVTVYNNNGGIVWNGFVNVIRVNKGIASVSRGPLMDVGNSVMVTYTPIIDATVEPIITGDQTTTTLAVDYDSVGTYGYLEKSLSGGQLIDGDTYGTYTNQANDLRDVFLVEAKDPQEDTTVNFTSATEPSITLECRGYYDWLGAFVVEDCDSLSMTSYVELSTKIWETIQFDLNYVVKTNDDPDSIEYNPMLTILGDCRLWTGKAIVEEQVTLGDLFNKRWLFYVDEERVCHYHQIPEDIEYKIRITDREQIVETILGDKIQPWDVQPRRWAALDDFMTSGPKYDTISSNYFRTDAKMMFIESVQFTAPNTVTLMGGRTGRLKQLMAQLGAGGS